MFYIAHSSPHTGGNAKRKDSVRSRENHRTHIKKLNPRIPHTSISLNPINRGMEARETSAFVLRGITVAYPQGKGKLRAQRKLS